MIQVDLHEGSYLSICKHYRAIYDTPCIQEDSAKWQQVKPPVSAHYHYPRLASKHLSQSTEPSQLPLNGITRKNIYINMNH